MNFRTSALPPDKNEIPCSTPIRNWADLHGRHRLSHVGQLVETWLEARELRDYPEPWLENFARRTECSISDLAGSLNTPIADVTSGLRELVDAHAPGIKVTGDSLVVFEPPAR